MPYAIVFKDNYTDEFDVATVQVYLRDDIAENIKKALPIAAQGLIDWDMVKVNEQYEQDVIDYKKYNYGFDPRKREPEVELGFGSNQWTTHNSVEQIVESFEFQKITQSEAITLIRILNLPNYYTTFGTGPDAFQVIESYMNILEEGKADQFVKEYGPFWPE